MDFTVEFILKDSIIQATVIGEFDNQELSKVSTALIEAQQEHDCYNILFDCRRAVSKLRTIEIHQRPKVAQSLGLSMHSKIAVVYKIQVDDYQFYENTAYNQGMIVKLFSDFRKARKWLLEAPDQT
jgi:hypothetical protein